MNTRWTCPNGCGTHLAPTRPRRDDARRYCLRCTERTGRLVERVPETLERRKERKREAERAARRAEAEVRRVERAEVRVEAARQKEQYTLRVKARKAFEALDGRRSFPENWEVDYSVVKVTPGAKERELHTGDDRVGALSAYRKFQDLGLTVELRAFFADRVYRYTEFVDGNVTTIIGWIPIVEKKKEKPA